MDVFACMASKEKRVGILKKKGVGILKKKGVQYNQLIYIFIFFYSITSFG